MNHLNFRPSVIGRHVAAALGALVLAGCSSLAPQYERSTESVTAPQWPVSANQPAAADGAVPAAQLPWRDFYTEPRLQQVIATALAHNRDLRLAALNIERARAQYRIQRAGLLPEVGASGGQSAQRVPASVSGTGDSMISRSYSAQVGISSYEIDVFGRIRDLQEQALQTYLASEETRRATQISLIGEVAGAYLTLAADLDLQRVAQQTLASRQDSYELQTERAEVGTASELEMRQAEGELEDARAQVLTIEQQLLLDRNALELLTGSPLPDALLPEPGSLLRLLPVQNIPVGLPADLLQNRPDIRAAERTLVGAHANIGAARAAFFPSISLTGTLGRASGDLEGLFGSGGGLGWTFVPQINLPIFTGGRLQAQLDTAEVDREIALTQYEKSIQVAFREVADVLAQRSVVDRQLATQQRRVDATSATSELVDLRYEGGVSSYLEVLDAQRNLFAAQQAQIQAELAQQASLVTLYKVLGGGWSVQDQQSADAAAQARADVRAASASVLDARQLWQRQ
ncbi:efflux transporter outer membrane subunit [Corticibacter populi]|uniref:Efflux transporter outer membrane subunit n=1 Tax=Corticibacter populi TaxID=1550736 RepID=A0A3M6QSJ7_9BURK|nr:efflux transporter outer membrane subunit [Corticibacter populi]RMX05821.1 efflux transporter outer membrane subunit [Corticibacter populi]RZS30867.1 multidrug efflux system outer membrane protein [Corticibacter populi]